MENISRREFVKKGLLFSASILAPFDLYAKSSKRVHIDLLKKPMEYHIKSGEKKSKRILIIAGIHGNEPGAYKAADILVDCDIKKGELIIVPRSNFTSILANTRGYNGDMNRKFAHISKEDADYFNVAMLKELILSLKPDVVISMHDGYGFNRLNKNHWGQSVVIDEKSYRGIDLYNTAKYVVENTNKKLSPQEQLSLHNTYTFSKNIHTEQRNALTGWCLQQGIPAFCIEASKQLPSLEDKVYNHLVMLETFFNIYNIEIEPTFSYLTSNISDSLEKRSLAKVELEINGRIHNFHKTESIRVKNGSNIVVKKVSGNRGTAFIPHHINLNWKSFHFSSSLRFTLKDDYKKVFDIKIIPI